MSDENPVPDRRDKPSDSRSEIQGTKAVISSNPTTKPSNELQDVKKELGGYERATLRWTIVIVCINALTCLFIGLQWLEMKSGSSDTHALAEASKTQADKMANVSDAADKIRQAAQDMVTQDQRIADNAQKAIEASNKQSEAALTATIDASKLDQRAWVVVKGIEGIPQLDQPWELHILFTNTGKTPAKHVLTSCNFQSGPSEDVLVFSEKVPLGAQNTLIVPGQEIYCRLPAITIPKVTQETLDVLSKKTIVVAVYGDVSYDDIFQKPHWLRFCRVMEPDGKAWDDCAKGGNDIVDGKLPN